MVQKVAEQSTRPHRNLRQAGAALAEAQREWSTAFIRYKLADPKRTDNMAKAMADQDVDLRGAEVDWVIAQATLETQRQEFEVERIRIFMQGEEYTRANQSDSRPN